MGQTFIKNGNRKFKLAKQKDAINQLNNFSNILNNMEKLNKEIDNYNGVITEEKLNEIASLINKEKRLNLTEQQISIVTNKYLSE